MNNCERKMTRTAEISFSMFMVLGSWLLGIYAAYAWNLGFKRFILAYFLALILAVLLAPLRAGGRCMPKIFGFDWNIEISLAVGLAFFTGTLLRVHAIPIQFDAFLAAISLALTASFVSEGPSCGWESWIMSWREANKIRIFD